MHYAIISDVHANADALRAVFAHADQQGIGHFVCLGDIVGYGPEPIECVDLVSQRCYLTLRGNHDDAVIRGAENFTARAKVAVDWTRELLVSPEDPDSGRRWAFMQGLPERFDKNGVLFVHGSPRDPVSEYLFKEDTSKDPQKIRMSLELVDKIVFVGHTHMPGVINEEIEFKSPQDLGGCFHFRKGEKAIVNVGSVGQPRDNDNRACYLEIRKNEMFWHRVPYDVEAVVKKIEANDRLANSLGARLRRGV